MKNYLRLLICLFVVSTLSNAQWVTGGLSGKYIVALASSGTNLFAGTEGDGIFLSTNNGANWTEVNTGLTDKFINVLAVNSSGVIFAGTDGGVFISTNNGTGWAQNNTGLSETDVTALVVSESNIFAGTYSISGGAIYQSTTGTSWTKISSSITSSIYLLTLASSGSDVFAGTTDGIYCTTNGGTNWLTLSSGLTSTYVYAFAMIGSTLFAGTQEFVFRSTNNGGNWTAVNTGYPYEYALSLAVNNTTLFAGTNGDVLFSNNNGSGWTKVTTGMTNPRVNALKVFGTHLFAGTSDGVWKRPLSEIVTSVEKNPTNAPALFCLEQNYPNPFNPTTTIGFTLQASGLTTLKIYDLLGREVATLVNEHLDAATCHERTFNAATLTSGIYIAKLQNGKEYQQKKLMLIK